MVPASNMFSRRPSRFLRPSSLSRLHRSFEVRERHHRLCDFHFEQQVAPQSSQDRLRRELEDARAELASLQRRMEQAEGRLGALELANRPTKHPHG